MISPLRFGAATTNLTHPMPLRFATTSADTVQFRGNKIDDDKTKTEIPLEQDGDDDCGSGD